MGNHGLGWDIGPGYCHRSAQIPCLYVAEEFSSSEDCRYSESWARVGAGWLALPTCKATDSAYFM